MSGSTIDFLLISGWKGTLPPIPTILMSPAACARNHLPIAVNITLHQEQSECAKKVVLLTSHHMNAERIKAAVKLFDTQLPKLAAKLRAC